MKCLKCGRELRASQECICTQNLRTPLATPQILQKDFKAEMAPPAPTTRNRANVAAVPTFSELMQKSKSQQGQSAGPPVGFTPVDEDGILLTKAMKLAPRVNLVGKVEVAKSWTEGAEPASVPSFDFSNHPAFESLEDLVPLPSENKDVAWSRPVELAPQASPSKAPVPAVKEIVTPTEEGEDTLVAVTAPGWAVLGALLLDGLLVFSFVAGFWVLALEVVGTTSSASVSVLIPLLLFTAVVIWVSSALFGFLLQGRSPGRFLFGIRLVDRQGEVPSIGRTAIRATLSLLSLVFFFGGFYMALFSRSRQTLHDWLTQTYPVRLKP